MTNKLNSEDLYCRPDYPTQIHGYHKNIWLTILCMFFMFIYPPVGIGAQSYPKNKNFQILSEKTGALDKPDDESQDSSEIRMNKADAFHATLSRSIDGTANWIDSFFREERSEIEEENSSLRLKLSGFKETSKGVDFKGKARLHLILPYLENKLHLFASSILEEDEEKIDYFDPADEENDKTRNFYLSMRYFFQAAENSNISFRAGLKFHRLSPALFVGPRYRYSQKWGSWNFRFIEDITYFTDDGWEQKASVDIEKLVSDSIFYRTNLSGRWREYETGYVYWIDTNFYHTIGDYKLLNYRVRGLFNTHPSNELTDVLAGIRYRQRIWKKWLFFEISPQLVFRREEDYDPSPGITISIEAFFGEDFMDYVKVPLRKEIN